MFRKIGFLGGGNMATAIITGLIRANYPAADILVSDISLEILEPLRQKFNLNITLDNAELCRQSEVILFAVKPQAIFEILTPLKSILQTNKPLILSIMAGVSISRLQQQISMDTKIIRCMPNTPALIQKGITALFAPNFITALEKSIAEKILSSVGHILWLEDEKYMNQVTAISGSGPAYFFYLFELLENNNFDLPVLFHQLLTLLDNTKSVAKLPESLQNFPLDFCLTSIAAMVESGINLGLSEEVSFLLVKDTAIGSMFLVQDSSHSLAELRAKVTSKKGTTEAALNVFIHSPLAQLIAMKQLDKTTIYEIYSQAISNAWQRSLELEQL